MGELNRNKNQQAAIKALSRAKKECYYVLCGNGPCQDELMELAPKLNIEKNISFLGFREDIPRILHACDCYQTLSKREGLGIASLEAMVINYFIENREGLQLYLHESQKIVKSFDQNETDRVMKEIYSSLITEELIV
ncbi:MAG: glycosyltransferase [Clostridiales bacterium]|nr:glycosyltransferase [Clostridiales bacterium]